MKISAAVILLLTASGSAQVATEANKGYRTPEGRARVARMLDAPDRDARQKPTELVRSMGLKPGMTVADLGTGVGYMLPYLSEAVGDSGRVLAQDISDDFLKQARRKARKANLKNVEYVKGSEKDANLPEGQADVVLALDAYHHFDYPAPMLASIRRGLKLHGRLVIVDFYKRPEAMPNGRAMEHIRLDQDDVVKEVTANGFRLISVSEHSPKSQYIAVFKKR